ncbi:MAG: hypothetical protein K8L99_27915 [Anaerolineae bacterium]|nr:hypothetical protein [Anaerolineae bacterium]
MFRLFRSHGTLAGGGTVAGAPIIDTKSGVRTETLLSVLTIVVVALLSHATLIPWLGYYWDDWITIWIGKAQGAAGLAYQMSWDRPFHATWAGFVYGIIGDRVLIWHVYYVLLLVGGALLLLWALRGLWPGQRFATMSMALLYAVYPGFLGQPFAQTYHSHYFALAMGILSLGLTIRAEQTQNRRTYALFTVLAMASGAICLFMFEIYASFEVLRLLLIGYLALRKQQMPDRRAFILRVARRWLPYVLVILAFASWRLFIFKSIRSETDLSAMIEAYRSNPLGQMIRVPADLVRDFMDTVIFAWFVPGAARVDSASQSTLLWSAILAGAAFLTIVIYERRTRRYSLQLTTAPTAPVEQWPRHMALLGLLAIIPALLPVVLADMTLKLVQLSDRFTLTALVPTVIFLVGFIFWGIRPKTRPWIIAGLVGIATMTHFNNANFYRNIWSAESDLWWQMYWRAPDLQPETVLVASTSPNEFFPSNTYEIWAPANLIYKPGATEQPEIYGVRLTETVADKIVTGQDYDYEVMSSIHFVMDFDKALMIYPPNEHSCLHVVDGARSEELPQTAPALLNRVAALSHIDQIITSEASHTTPAIFFGSEPPHRWCYYFQKGTLARQMGEWETVAALGDEVRDKGYYPQAAEEWLPFIQGYAEVGRCDDARELAAMVMEAQPFMEAEVLPSVCEV